MCRILAGDITSQNVMLRCLRRVLQIKVDHLLGQIQVIEDAEQAKKNRMMSRKGVEKGRRAVLSQLFRFFLRQRYGKILHVLLRCY